MGIDRLPKGMRTVRGVIAASAALVLLGAAVAAWAWPGHAAKLDVQRIVAETHGSLNGDAFDHVTAGMTPADLAIARRHDPFLKTPPGAQGVDLASFDLKGRPDLGIDATSPEEAMRINALLPADHAAMETAKPFVLAAGTVNRARAERCLTQAIYYEAATQPRDGQEGVAQVVLNRVRDPYFPNSVCAVVYQGCQFSFVCDGSMAKATVAWAWKRAQDVADHALNGYVATQVGTATHYHADYVMPDWSGAHVKLVQIGQHIFYRWKGAAGDISSFVERYAGAEPAIVEANYRVNRFAPAAAKTAFAALKASTHTVVTESGATRVETVLGGTMAGRKRPDKDEVAKINASLAKYEQTITPAATPTPTVSSTAAASSTPATESGASAQ
ncbi:MAG TPA: cell wall hydrolase [Caulobacteraceae bacterium]|jgi:spore germination cell wall hydrolase CwlJ-like protein|nr:cell wall hydrolase [Caulobacteraceae bacterium]